MMLYQQLQHTNALVQAQATDASLVIAVDQNRNDDCLSREHDEALRMGMVATTAFICDMRDAVNSIEDCHVCHDQVDCTS